MRKQPTVIPFQVLSVGTISALPVYHQLYIKLRQALLNGQLGLRAFSDAWHY